MNTMRTDEVTAVAKRVDLDVLLPLKPEREEMGDYSGWLKSLTDAGYEVKGE